MGPIREIRRPPPSLSFFPRRAQIRGSSSKAPSLSLFSLVHAYCTAGLHTHSGEGGGLVEAGIWNPSQEGREKQARQIPERLISITIPFLSLSLSLFTGQPGFLASSSFPMREYIREKGLASAVYYREIWQLCLLSATFMAWHTFCRIY